MIKNWILRVLCVWGFCFVHNAQGMIYDNRYFPLYPKQIVRNPCEPSFLAIQPLFMFADKAYGFQSEIGLPEIDGHLDPVHPQERPGYNVKTLEESLIVSGKISQPILRSDLRSRDMAWNREGFVQAQGSAFYYEQSLGSYLSLGCTALVLHYSSCHEFFFYENTLGNSSPGERMYINQARSRIHKALGVQAPVATDIGFGDLDLYLRLSNYWDYTYRCRLINAGCNLGCIFPTSSVRNINNPASLPIGGNGHWGLYGQVDSQFQLKEDFLIGGLARIIKRFKKTQNMRLPVLTESVSYGSIIRPTTIDPGITFVFSLYAKLLGIGECYGIGAGYTLVGHQPDSFTEHRPEGSVEANIRSAKIKTKWRAEYATINASYDFARLYPERLFMPKITFAWDIPTNQTFAEEVYKTNSISLMFSVDY
jgi:hypothetical protein